MKRILILFTLIFAFSPVTAHAGMWDMVKNYAQQARESWLGKKISENKMTSCAAALTSLGAVSYLWSKTPAYKISDEILEKETKELNGLINKLETPWLYPWLVYKPTEITKKTYKGRQYSVAVSLDEYPRTLTAEIIINSPNNMSRQFETIVFERLDE